MGMGVGMGVGITVSACASDMLFVLLTIFTPLTSFSPSANHFKHHNNNSTCDTNWCPLHPVAQGKMEESRNNAIGIMSSRLIFILNLHLMSPMQRHQQQKREEREKGKAIRQ
ncbi:hypothetical protein N658DRAFT_25990 [Parathielavia hyrcaniae]|uniref:Uncharacterized protein n=1 Tax=Parathielavia hyrcaniae TaxID=113614 RepID=A0AAN6T720_9PEZI|nr:hypothetical protein N658DRAFT_25990 [Parathielavia hyrcaniae]